MADYIFCPKCGMKSYNPNDIKEKYCGNCHQYHSTMVPMATVISYKGTPHVAIADPERAEDELRRLVSYGCLREDLTTVIVSYLPPYKPPEGAE